MITKDSSLQECHELIAKATHFEITKPIKLNYVTWATWILKIETEGRNLTEYEKNFVKGMRYRVMYHEVLTEPQEKLLERIYSERTN